MPFVHYHDDAVSVKIHSVDIVYSYAHCSSVAALLHGHAWMRIDADAECNMCGLLSHVDYYRYIGCDFSLSRSGVINSVAERRHNLAHWFDLFKEAGPSLISWQNVEVWNPVTTSFPSSCGQKNQQRISGHLSPRGPELGPFWSSFSPKLLALAGLISDCLCWPVGFLLLLFSFATASKRIGTQPLLDHHAPLIHR